MGLVIGMDEAGYGPNLGPLVVTVTVWEVPGNPRRTNFWKLFDEICHSCPERGDGRLHVADSKQVYSPARGLAPLERSVLAAMRLADIPCDSFRRLWSALVQREGEAPAEPHSALNGSARREPRPPGTRAHNPLSLALFDVALCRESAAHSSPKRKRGIGLRETAAPSLARRANVISRGNTQSATSKLALGASIDNEEPWFLDADLDLPHERHEDCASELAGAWRKCCERKGVRLRAIRSDIVLTERFNRLTREIDSKGVALSRLSMQLLRSVWEPGDGEPAWVIADKHGGRNRYDDLLAEVLDGEMIFRVEEGAERSVYRVGSSVIHFQTRAEEHLPVALASMVSKYVRELAMVLFNRFWSQHVPDLKPTKGYPTDAWRFREQIATAQQALCIPDDVLWRER